MKQFAKYLLFVGLTAGCEGEEPVIREAASAYFPLRTGIYHIYTVDEVRYELSTPEEFHYEVMMEVVDSFPSAGDTHTYVVYRSRRFAASDPWEALDTWSVREDENRIIVSEGNTPFVKMSFPLVSGVRWNGNAYNNLGDDLYEYRDSGQSLTLNGMTFEKTVTVEQERNEDPIVYHDIRAEVYARDVGMVSKEVVQLTYCTGDQCLGQQKIDYGTELKMVIKEYGVH